MAYVIGDRDGIPVSRVSQAGDDRLTVGVDKRDDHFALIDVQHIEGERSNPGDD